MIDYRIHDTPVSPPLAGERVRGRGVVALAVRHADIDDLTSPVGRREGGVGALDPQSLTVAHEFSGRPCGGK